MTVRSKVLRSGRDVKLIDGLERIVVFTDCRIRTNFNPAILQSDGSTIFAHSYRNASTGSSFDARSAGTRPLATPTASSASVESMTVANEIWR